MRIREELSDALFELDESITKVKPLVTRSQYRRIEDAVVALRVIVGVMPDPRPVLDPTAPPTEDAAG